MNRHGILVIGLAAAAIAIVSGLILIPRLSAHPVLSGYIEGEPLYHASLDPAEYRRLLDQNGFEVIDMVAEDPTCGGRTVWLARRRQT